MSTPHPLEEAAQTNRGEGMWDPWKGPTPSSFGADALRSPYTILEGLGSGAAKGQAVLGGLLHTQMAPDVSQMESEGLSPQAIANARKQAEEMQQHGADAFAADARERVKALTPDAATTGVATQVLHGVTSAGEQMILGSLVGGPAGGAAAVGSGEGLSRFQELREQGVTPGTAGASAAVTGVTSAAGALLPAAYGSTLLTRLATGVVGNTAFGVVNRGADHLILAANGYSEMAEQAKVWDGTQMLVDAALGATFGGVHHAMSPAEERTVTALKQNTDAALTANLALKDRGSAPGVAVDPASAQAHQAALEKALTDVVQGKPVDVADTGIKDAQFLKRPEPDQTPALQLMADALKETGFLDEEANLRDLEAQFERRTKGEPEPAKEPVRGSAPDFMTELEKKPANPTEPTERMVNGVRVEMQRDPFDEGAVHLNSLQAEEGQKGAGTGAMKEITDLADKHGVRMTLDAKPFGENAMDADKLRDFYKRFGFETTEQGDGRAVMERLPGAKKAQVNATPRWHIANEPVWEMSPEELGRGVERLRERDVELLTGAFGNKEDAGWFARAADSNSDRTYAKAEKMVEALPADKKAIVERWEHGEGQDRITPEELGRLHRDVSEVANAETPEELAQLLKTEITKLGDHTDPEKMDIDELSAMMQLKEGYRLAGEKGWDVRRISDETIRAAAKRFSDPEDAAFMLRRFIKPPAAPGADPVAQVLHENPSLQITDESGRIVNASNALEATKPEMDWFTATKAATDCFARRGG